MNITRLELIPRDCHFNSFQSEGSVEAYQVSIDSKLGHDLASRSLPTIKLVI